MTIDPDALSLAGRVALVTGAAGGIGEAIARGYARFGASLALCDRDADGLARVVHDLASSTDVSHAVLDVRDAEAIDAFVADAARGGLHVLVNNAGGTFKADFEAVRPKGERALVDLNFTSASHLIRCALPHLARGASILNITSVEAHRAAPGYAVYAAMKAGLESLTRSLALELGARGIRVNCIAPDAIPTAGTGPMELFTPLPGPGHPDDVAGAALYLASDLARFVTGTTLHVDGGTHAAGGWRRTPEGDFDL